MSNARRNLSALSVLAEHRYFGESFRFGDDPCELSPDFNATRLVGAHQATDETLFTNGLGLSRMLVGGAPGRL